MLNNSESVHGISEGAVDDTDWPTFKPAGHIETWDGLLIFIQDTTLDVRDSACSRVEGDALDGPGFVPNTLYQEVTINVN